MLLFSMSVAHCCYPSCQVVNAITLPDSWHCCFSACQVVNAIILRASWSLLLLSLPGCQCCYSPGQWSVLLLCLSGGQCCYSPGQWSVILLFLSGGQCCYYPPLLVLIAALPVRWCILLLFLSGRYTVSVCWSNCCCSCQWSVLLLCVSVGQCWYYPPLLVLIAALPVRWCILLLLLSGIGILFLFAGLTAVVLVACTLYAPVRRSSLSMVCSPCHVFTVVCSFLPCDVDCAIPLLVSISGGAWCMLLLVSVM
jgi:hypothetical protein